MDYALIKTLHILLSTIFFGGGAVSAFFKLRTKKLKDLNTLLFVHETIIIADNYFTIPTVIGLPLTGLWMLGFPSILNLDPWLIWGIIFYIIAGLFWIPAAYLQIKLKKLIKEAIEKNTDLSEKYYRYSRYWFYLGLPSFTSALIVFYLIVSKDLPF